MATYVAAKRNGEDIDFIHGGEPLDVVTKAVDRGWFDSGYPDSIKSGLILTKVNALKITPLDLAGVELSE